MASKRKPRTPEQKQRAHELRAARMDEINAKHAFRMENDPEYAANLKEYRAKTYSRQNKGGPYVPVSPEEKVANKLIAAEKLKEATRLKREANPKPKKKKYNQPFKDKTPEQQARIRETKLLREAADPEKYLNKKEENKRIHRERMLNDPEYAQKQRDGNKKYYTEVRRFNRTKEEKMYNSLKGRIKAFLHIPASGRKIGGFSKLVGCERVFFRQYIESQFIDGMTWENWGDVWHIDHCLPFSLCDGNKDLAIKLSHYTNLRPLCKWENLSKKDKFIPELWPQDFPFSPEDFGLDRKVIPYFQALELRDKMLPTCCI